MGEHSNSIAVTTEKNMTIESSNPLLLSNDVRQRCLTVHFKKTEEVMSSEVEED